MPKFSQRYASYLFHDSRTGIFYLRFRFPQDLRLKFGRAEFKRSLRTKDKSTARFLSGYTYSFINQSFTKVLLMDKRWAKIYLDELYQRLLERGTIALATGDDLYTFTPTANHLLPDVPINLADFEDEFQGYIYEDMFEEFERWFELQKSLKVTPEEIDRLKLTFNFIEQNAASWLPSMEFEHSENVAMDGLEIDSSIIGHKGLLRFTDEGVAKIAVLSPDKFINSSRTTSVNPSGLRDLITTFSVNSTISQSEFAQELFKVQSKLFTALLKIKEEIDSDDFDLSGASASFSRMIHVTTAQEVMRHLNAYRDALRSIYSSDIYDAGTSHIDEVPKAMLDQLSPKMIEELKSMSSDEYRDIKYTPKQVWPVIERNGERIAINPDLAVQNKALALKASPELTQALEVDSQHSYDPLPFLDSYNEFMSEKEKEISAATVKDYGIRRNWFVEQFGEDFDIRKINKSLAGDIKKQLLKKVVRDGSTDTISPKTLNKFINCYYNLWDWVARHEDGFDSDQNPFKGLRMRESKRSQKRTRIAHTDENILKILNYKISKPNKGVVEASKYPKAAQWYLKVLIFTGMRRSELAMVKLQDVKEIHGVWTVSVAEQLDPDEAQSNKSENAIRTIPVHQQLIDMGFIEFVESEKEADRKNDFLFEELFLYRDSKPNEGWAEPMWDWFKRNVMPKCGIEAPSDKVLLDMHSFRTGFIGKLIECGVNGYLLKQLVGHVKDHPEMSSNDTTFEGYGRDYRTKLNIMKKIVDAVTFDETNN